MSTEPQRAVTVRRVRPEDVALVRRLRLASLKGAPDAFCASYDQEAAQPLSFWEERVAGNAAGVDTVSYLAFVGDAVAGSVVGARDSAERAHLYAMWVEPFARRNGVGRALVDAVVAWASAATCEELLLEVLEGNDAAERLYQRCGFEVLSARQRGDRSPPVLERTWRRRLVD
jgi:ribosomal protein S18 acetylase RimI-like enzyme